MLVSIPAFKLMFPRVTGNRYFVVYPVPVVNGA